MKELYQKHRVLFRFTIILVLIVLTIGTVEVISAIQQEQIDKNTNSSDIVELKEQRADIPAYNVDGLTDEQIKEYIQKQREYDKE